MISKKLIELHGGTLKIHSIPNKGSDVYFTLPLAMENVKDQHNYLKHEITAAPAEEKNPGLYNRKTIQNLNG